MSNSTTEQQQTSKDKSIIEGIGFKEFSAICEEYKIVEDATRELITLAKNPDTEIRHKIDIYKWIVEMNIGKPKQMQDINLSGEENIPNITIVEYVSEDNVMGTLIDKVGGLENIIQILRDKGYQDIPDIKDFAKTDDQLNSVEDVKRVFNGDVDDKGEGYPNIV